MYREHYTKEEAIEKMYVLLQYLKEEKAFVYYVLGNENKLAGMVWSHLYNYNGEVRMHISAPDVAKEYRRRGYASQMYEAMYSDMSQLGIKRVYTNVDKINQQSLKFHYNHGFSEEAYQYIKTLS